MLEQPNGLRISFTRRRFQVSDAASENVVQRVGMLGRPGSLRSDQFEAERVREPARDLVLQGEQIAGVAADALGPQMGVGLGIDQLGTDADLIARPPDASLEHIAHTEIAADLLGVDRLVPVR